MIDEQALAAVDVITQSCRYRGFVPTRGQRLSEVLGDPNSGVLRMTETLTTVAGSSSSDVRWQDVSLRKDDILLVIPTGDHEAPARRRNHYVKKHRYGAMIVLPGFVISGIVYLSSRVSVVTMLDASSSLPSFLGLTDVTVHRSGDGLLPAQCDVAIVRRPAIEAIELTDQPVGDAKPTDGDLCEAASGLTNLAQGVDQSCGIL